MKSNMFMMGVLMAGVVAVPAAMAEGMKHHSSGHMSHKAMPSSEAATTVSTDAVVVSPSTKASDAETNPRNVERDYQGRSMTLGGTTTGSSLRSGMPTSTKPGGASNP